MIIVIPSIGESPLLPDLLDVLCDEPGVSEIFLIDNAPSGTPALDLAKTGTSDVLMALTTGFIKYMKVPPAKTIYDSWNFGIAAGRRTSQNVAILNDDLVMRRGALMFAEKALSAGYMLMGMNYFDGADAPMGNLPIREVHGTFRTGGFGGFAFLITPDCPQVTEGYRWWYGDDDLAHQIKAVGGRLGVATGAPVSHPTPSISGNKQRWLPEAIASDTALFRSTWPGVE